MNYTEARSKFKTGDILAWSHGSWATFHDAKVNLIRIGTRSEYSHVGLTWVVGGRVLVVEAVVPQIRIFPLSKLLPFYQVQMPKRLSKKGEEFMLSQVGGEYSQWEAVKAFIGHVKNGSNSYWECAELVNTTWGVDISAFGQIKATPTETVKYAMETLNASMRLITA